jgi:FkbM family methyltransferase
VARMLIRNPSDSLRRFLRETLGAFGFRLTREENYIETVRRRLLITGRFSSVLDVGANAGQYLAEIRRAGFHGHVDCFEPHPTAFELLQKHAHGLGPATMHKIALGASSGEATLYGTNDTACSSLRKPSAGLEACHEGARVVTGQRVPVRRIDELNLEALTAKNRCWLKIDTQGTELAVISGAAKSLGQIQAIELELSLSVLYEGQPLLPVVWTYLQDAGYIPFWIERGWRDPRNGCLGQVDAIFVRPELL